MAMVKAEGEDGSEGEGDEDEDEDEDEGREGGRSTFAANAESTAHEHPNCRLALAERRNPQTKLTQAVQL
jgi:hypothetical protein